MLCVAEFTIPSESFPFGETLDEMPDVVITVDQIVPTDESALPFFWVQGSTPEAFMEQAALEGEIDDLRELERVEDTALFRAKWGANEALVDGLKDIDATIVEAVGTAEHWRFEVRTSDRDAFNDFRVLFEDHGYPITLDRLYDLETLREHDHRQLTDIQRETLVSAFQDGYYDKPRGISQMELGTRFDVSRRAISERLRRGTRNLIADTLVHALDDAPEET
ncbi:hypothetical protein G9C85_15400 [Halorubellus sp. JP-L1]|uniref:helix-turn-helix domain-containing protein n=1 Tax=Halorubellus sp. JP-L1 TaxID=2715753 RepID=UPI00140DB60A|nr:helix-turn-helix domain-containing protein [Halorubellus sp. JP-L1]NHN43005.1 hypothetical protein [Halorubellus sp. JP-L1]